MSTAQVQGPLRHSAESHLHRLEPLHPATVAFLAVQHGVPVSSPPVGPAGGVAATDAGRMTQYCPGARSARRGCLLGSVAVCLGKAEIQGALRMETVEAWLLCRICMISRFHVSAAP